jgi:hypothetical protein
MKLQVKQISCVEGSTFGVTFPHHVQNDGGIFNNQKSIIFDLFLKQSSLYGETKFRVINQDNFFEEIEKVGLKF